MFPQHPALEGLLIFPSSPTVVLDDRKITEEWMIFKEISSLSHRTAHLLVMGRGHSQHLPPQEGHTNWKTSPTILRDARRPHTHLPWTAQDANQWPPCTSWEHRHQLWSLAFCWEAGMRHTLQLSACMHLSGSVLQPRLQMGTAAISSPLNPRKPLHAFLGCARTWLQKTLNILTIGAGTTGNTCMSFLFSFLYSGIPELSQGSGQFQGSF